MTDAEKKAKAEAEAKAKADAEAKAKADADAKAEAEAKARKVGKSHITNACNAPQEVVDALSKKLSKDETWVIGVTGANNAVVTGSKSGIQRPRWRS